MIPNLKETNSEIRPRQGLLVEVLGDTVVLSHVVYAIVISLVLSFGGYWIGLQVFPGLVSKPLVNSYSLLLAMIGSIVGVVINAKLFKPKRVLSQSESNPDEQRELLEELEIDPAEESRLLENDLVTKAELENLNLLHLFNQKAGEQ